MASASESRGHWPECRGKGIWVQLPQRGLHVRTGRNFRPNRWVLCHVESKSRRRAHRAGTGEGAALRMQVEASGTTAPTEAAGRGRSNDFLKLNIFFRAARWCLRAGQGRWMDQARPMT